MCGLLGCTNKYNATIHLVSTTSLHCIVLVYCLFKIQCLYYEVRTVILYNNLNVRFRVHLPLELKDWKWELGSQKVKYNLDAVPSETEMGIGREPSSPENQKHQNRSKPPREVSRVIRPLLTFYNPHTCTCVDVVNSLFFMFTKGRDVLELWPRVQVNSLHINVLPHPSYHKYTVRPYSAQSQALVITAGLKRAFGQCQLAAKWIDNWYQVI